MIFVDVGKMAAVVTGEGDEVSTLTVVDFFLLEEGLEEDLRSADCDRLDISTNEVVVDIFVFFIVENSVVESLSVVFVVIIVVVVVGFVVIIIVVVLVGFVVAAAARIGGSLKGVGNRRRSVVCGSFGRMMLKILAGFEWAGPNSLLHVIREDSATTVAKKLAMIHDKSKT